MLFVRKRVRHVPEPEPRPSTIDVGSFAHGVCGDCEWQGPGRRARSAARRDADAHLEQNCSPRATHRG